MTDNAGGFMRFLVHGCALLALVFHAGAARAQAPVADLDYAPSISKPAYTSQDGPVVRIDEAHHNYHTMEGRYAPFASLLRRDGYRIEASRTEFSAATLAGANIMVIANAEAAQSGEAASSAFTNAEITAIRHWVEQGGALLIIADHPPFSDSASALAQAFGFEFASGVALIPNAAGQFGPIATFESDKGLMASALSSERLPSARIDAVMTFTGSAFRAPPTATPVLVFPEGARSFRLGPGGPDFSVPGTPIAGLSQGALLEVGKGRMAVFGEAAMYE